METKISLLLAGIVGVLAYMILPSFFKIFAFLIPAITLGFAFSKKFNWILFLTISLLFVLFPSSFLTLDSSNSFNMIAFTNYTTNIVQALVTLFGFIIPIVGGIGTIYAFVQGNPDKGIEMIIKLVATIIIVSILLFFGSMLGWELFSLELVKPIYNGFWKIIKNIANFFTQDIPKFFGLDYDEELKMLDDIELLSVIDSPKTFSLTIASIYPLIISIICIVISIILYISKVQIKKEKEQDEQRFNRPNQYDFSFLIFILIILISAFVLFLTYTVDTFVNYQNVGFFSIYLLITSICAVFLTLGIGSPTKISKETIYGIVIGISLLFLYANMFTQVRTFDLLSLEYRNLTFDKILSQFLFVAPTESLLFHVFLPSLIVYYYLLKNRVFTKEELDLKIISTKTNISSLESAIEIHKTTNNPKAMIKTAEILDRERKKLSKLERSPIGIKSEKLTPANFAIYLAYSFVFNLLFAILHYFKSGLTFEIFWTSGIGFLYLSSGLILSLISYRFGWLSGILTHAIHNSISLYLISLMGGI